MNTIIKFLVFSFLFFFMTACQSVKNTLSMKKEKTTDEFLIEKKNPLVLPPNFSNLPKPKEELDETDEKKENLDLSKVLKKSGQSKNIKSSNTLEKSISNILNKK